MEDTLNEREFELVNIVGAELGSNQRDLSHHMKLSLGATNMLLKRLISKGYIRIRQLNKRKVEYILTPQGFAEKMQKSVKYTLKTMRSISLIKEQVKDVITRLYGQGERSFIVLGKSDFSLIIDLVFHEMNVNDYTLTHVEEIPSNGLKGTLLICKENIELNGFQGPVIDLIQEIAKKVTT